MSIILKKGERVDLSKETPNLKKMVLGLGWDIDNSNREVNFDLDLSIFMLNSKGRIPENSYFIFHNNLNSPDGAISYRVDKRELDIDDKEIVHIEFEKLDDSIEEIAIIVIIGNAEIRNQNFEEVKNSFIRLYDLDTNEEICRYELDNDFTTETAVEFGSLYKKSGSWRFKAIGLGFNSGLEGFLEKFIG